MYSKIKIMTKTTIRLANIAPKKKDRKVVIDQEEVLKRRIEYIDDLFRDEQKEKTMRQEDEDLTGNKILKSEIEAALKEMKNQKSPGNDKISREMLTNCKETGISKICCLANKIYDSGIILKQMKESIFIPIPKKGDFTECGNYRLMSLMSHITKIILRVLMRRIRNKLLPEIGAEQFGSKKDRETRNAIFFLRVVGKGYRNVKRYLPLIY